MHKPTSHIAVPKVGEGKRGEQGYLGYLLRQAAAAYRLRVERALADLGVTPPQFSVLTMLANYPGISNADLARLAVLTPQTVSICPWLRCQASERRSIERRHPRLAETANGVLRLQYNSRSRDFAVFGEIIEQRAHA